MTQEELDALKPGDLIAMKHDNGIFHPVLMVEVMVHSGGWRGRWVTGSVGLYGWATVAERWTRDKEILDTLLGG